MAFSSSWEFLTMGLITAFLSERFESSIPKSWGSVWSFMIIGAQTGCGFVFFQSSCHFQVIKTSPSLGVRTWCRVDDPPNCCSGNVTCPFPKFWTSIVFWMHSSFSNTWLCLAMHLLLRLIQVSSQRPLGTSQEMGCLASYGYVGFEELLNRIN